MNKTKISYLDYTWNPIAMRCTPVSIGCANCWHLAMAKRLAGNPSICLDERLVYGNGAPLLKHREFGSLLHLKKPARIGVQFMGDLFHEKVPWEFQIKVFEAMATGDHWFFLLTKRPQRMKEFFQTCEDYDVTEWPGIWLGVSISTNDDLWMVEKLLQIPAAHRWISYEPGLGPVDLSGWLFIDKKGDVIEPPIHWVVCGGEIGSKARPMHPDWVRSVRDQCQAAGVPFFFKSWGMWINDNQLQADHSKWIGKINSEGFYHVGYGKAGHILDDEEWLKLP